MIYELEYDIDSQIENHSFVNEDYEKMSNTKVKYYMGDNTDGFVKEAEKRETEEDFQKWLQ